MRTVLFGGSGMLGTELLRLDNSILAPTRSEVDIQCKSEVELYIKSTKPDVIIHCAAITDDRWIDLHREEAVCANIIGTANIAVACRFTQSRLVYISTDYVYRGDRGNYRESDSLYPCNYYAWTKLGGEAGVRCATNHLIIRTSFGSSAFPYPIAFVDKWVSKDYVDVVAPMILDAAFSPLTGVLNLGTERKTIFDYASRRNPTVEPKAVTQSACLTPADTSLNLDRWNAFKSDQSFCVSAKRCRVCGSDEMGKYLDLGLMPLANNLAMGASEARAQDRYPLQVLFCKTCGLSQLTFIVNRESMFGFYTYRSSISHTFANHCRSMADDLIQRGLLDSNDLVVDIAGNDGALLGEFQAAVNLRVLNVDPATNIAAISNARGIPVINEFWSTETASQILRDHGHPRIITATNVFAHVDDVHTFLVAVKSCLNDSSMLIIECPYLVDFVEKREYDTVYFEHLSYFLVTPLKRLIESVGLHLLRVSHHSIHGGSIRLEIGRNASAAGLESVNLFIERESQNGYLAIEKYQSWAESIYALIKDFADKLLAIKKTGAKIAGFAASAKGNTLLNASRMSPSIIEYIVDDTPEKIGRYSPGTGIPIVSREMLRRRPPDYIVILSWNFRDEIIKSLNSFNGSFIIPIPRFEIIKRE